MKKTPQQIQNLKDALVWWKTVPEANVDLNYWRDNGTPPYTCNTICCFGGWCAVQPKLVAQGLYPEWGGAPRLVGRNDLDSSGVAQELFGDYQMFASSGCHRHDKDRGETDHEAVTHRIKMALKEKHQCGIVV